MDPHDLPDIATFPDLFAGMEQFIAEQFAQFRRTGTIAAALAAPAGMLLWWLANRLA